MKITIKTLQGKMVDIEVLDAETVGDIKVKIQSAIGTPIDQQKVIHYGKVLTDPTKRVSELNIKDKDFLVLMLVKVFVQPLLPNIRENQPHLQSPPKSQSRSQNKCQSA